ncbi:MAG TPA: Smr/MutS family protein [Allosphingosinicella sp.]|nr:Smr/MutS family protein [Allosphingosinicella sp.]
MRRLSAEERTLWAKVVESVNPLRTQPPQRAEPARQEQRPAEPRNPPRPSPARPAAPSRPQLGTTLDGSWDRRLGRGLVQPEMTVDLHGHNLATAYALLDERLERAIRQQVRVLLLITGKAPKGEPPVERGRIRAAVGDWLAASRHAGSVAAVRNAHPRHGGAGAFYIVLRRAK